MSDYDFSEALRPLFYAMVLLALLALVAAFFVGRCSQKYTISVDVKQAENEGAKR